jgi:CRISPR-associated protein Cmr6
MIEPLVHGGQAQAVSVLIGQGLGNAGLIWDRYLPLWSGNEREDKIYDPLSGFVERFNGSGNDSKQQRERFLNQRRSRYERALAQLAQRRKQASILFEARLTWRFATGLGNDHPTENGFSFDHVTGLPVIPSTAVKGLCRAAASSFGWSEKEIEALFGPSEILPGIGGWQGHLFFFDAFPVQWPQLAVDIANSHHAGYYGSTDTTSDRPKGRKTDPLETDDPNPVHFLAVAKGAHFLFPLLAPENEKTRIEDLLRNAIALFGVGAKTAVGYGRFSPESGAS